MPDGEPSGRAGSNALSTSIGWRCTFFSLSTLKMLLDRQDRKHPRMRIEREGRALAHRQQPGDRIDLAIGQDHAGDRAVAELAGLGVKLRRRDQLLAQIGRGVDQKPVRAVGADRDRGLGAPQFGIFASRLPAHRTSAIPLRNAAAGRGAQDDDAKHDPSPGASRRLKIRNRATNAARWTPASDTIPQSGTCQARKSTCVRCEAVAAAYLRVAHAYMLISMPTGTSTIFGAFQAILALLLLPDELRPCRLRYCGSKSSPVKSFAWNPHVFMLQCERISRSCAGPAVKTTWDQAFRGCSQHRECRFWCDGRCRLRIKNV